MILVSSFLATIPLSCKIKILLTFKKTIIKFLSLFNPYFSISKYKFSFLVPSPKFLMENLRSRLNIDKIHAKAKWDPCDISLVFRSNDTVVMLDKNVAHV